ncbi:hypothetical protein CC86DRAFT_454078 [Ophiobolus disseminans]|uniref:Uncharacterized protein n=1 Tax=Ophiobolus disseminans TaxID=1469910 RepID=A0A6A7A861_9PLEO|nr:hypothetical protein CC86DRAFT_454078 [Ophiobolus disseminans]
MAGDDAFSKAMPLPPPALGARMNDNKILRTQQHMTASQPSSSRLLHLPGELRNRIYTYTLTSERLLVYVKPDGPKKGSLAVANTGTNIDFNQVKYVCRQLYYDTAGLELKYSSVAFNGTCFYGTDPARTFLNFLGACATSNVSWPTNIILSTRGMLSALEPAGNFLRIADFCRMNPCAKVDYIDGCLSMNRMSPCHFIRRASFLALSIRRTPTAFVSRADTTRILTWTKEEHVARINVPNFRIWPAEREIARRDATQLEMSPTVKEWLRSRPALQIIVEGWFENGI